MENKKSLLLNVNFENKIDEERKLILRKISNLVTDICEEECIEVLIEEVCLTD